MSATAPAAARAAQRRPPMRPTALVVGPLPPPYHGGSVATRYLLGSSVSRAFRLVHLDTTDPRTHQNMGRLDVVNIGLALAHFWRYLRLVGRERPDLVYVPVAQNRLGFLRDALFLLSARLLRRRVVVHVHGGGFRAFHDGTDALTRAVVRASLRRVAGAIVLGDGLRPMLHDLVPPACVAVIPNGIEDPYADGERRTGAAEPGDARVVYLGTLVRSKGFLDVLAAAALLAAERPRLRYAFAGSFAQPSDRAEAERYLRAGLRERVELVGVVAGEAKAELLRSGDLFVFPTYYPYEGHPYVLLEAMAAGLAIVTTARAAIQETIVDGETGVIVPERDPHALAAAIRRLADDPALRARLGAAARKRFLERYTLDTWATSMSAAFERALAGA